MEDNEIIKALEGCGNWQSDKTCDECPANTYGFGCAHKMAKHTLDLINRQKAEIKSLTENLEALGDPLQDAHYKIAEQQAEIERLKARNDELNALNKTASIEAIKEFAERLKAYFNDGNAVMYMQPIIHFKINDLVAEMTEGRENG